MSVQVIARLRLAVIALVGCLALGLTGAARASAEETVTFNYTGGEQEFKVPAGVTSVHVVAVGSEGGTDPGAARGGKGTVVRGDLSVSPGEVLYVEVGGVPFNGGGSSSLLEEGGKGGGASDVRTVSIGAEPSPGNEASLNSRLLVAGGGGGGGFESFSESIEPRCPGGPGGGAEENGTAGTSCGWPGGGGGGAGEVGKGGAGGITYEREIVRPLGGDGEPGRLGAGGGPSAESSLGGGGGGGLYGGGGGGFQNVARGPGPGTLYAGNGGGGGGSNLVPSGGGHAIDEDGAPPSVVISYYTPPKATCATNTGTIMLSPGLTGTPVHQRVTVNGTLKGCTGEPFTEAKYAATLTTTSKVACTVLSGLGAPTFGSVKYAWTPKTKATEGTLSLPLSETGGVALTGELESGPYSPLTLSGTASESYTNAAKCGLPQGKSVTAVTKGRFTGSAVAFF